MALLDTTIVNVALEKPAGARGQPRPFAALSAMIDASTAVGPIVRGLLIAVIGTDSGWRGLRCQPCDRRGQPCRRRFPLLRPGLVSVESTHDYVAVTSLSPALLPILYPPDPRQDPRLGPGAVHNDGGVCAGWPSCPTWAQAVSATPGSLSPGAGGPGKRPAGRRGRVAGRRCMGGPGGRWRRPAR